MARITRFEAADILARCGAAKGDFHALPSDAVAALIEAADAQRYRRPRNANGSRARYFHSYLRRIADRRD